MSLYSKIMECGEYFSKNVRGISKIDALFLILFPIAFLANLFPLYLQRQAKIEEKCMEEYKTELERIVKKNADKDNNGVDDKEREKFFEEYCREIPLNDRLTKKIYGLPPDYEFKGNDWYEARCTITENGMMTFEKKVETSPHGYLKWIGVGNPFTPEDQLEILYSWSRK